MNTKIFFTLFCTALFANEEKIDFLMTNASEMLGIPGVAVAVVRDGDVLLTKGYGTRNLIGTLRVDEDTLFSIASCSKAFTALALGMLVDEGALSWDDPVIDHIPEFRLHDIYVTHHITIRDLAAHRSGLPRHEMLWYCSTFSRSELLKKLPSLQPASDLRSKFQYSNLMYAIAGIVIERVSGKTWEEFIQERIFLPLEMDRSNCSIKELKKAGNYAIPHTEVNGRLTRSPFVEISNIAPAISINSSAADMAKWMALQLSDGMDLVDKYTLQEMHTVQTSIGNKFFNTSPYLFGYGIGWFTGIYKGHYVVTHRGDLDGFISTVVLIPNEKIGVAVLINADHYHFFPPSAAYAIIDVLLGEEEDFLSQVEDEVRVEETEEWVEKPTVVETIHPLESYVGEFFHPGYGMAEISLEEGALILVYNNREYLLEHTGYDYFTAIEQVKESVWFTCCFFGDPSGEVIQLYLGLEPSLPFICFMRQGVAE